eukprot:s1573_g13.t1
MRTVTLAVTEDTSDPKGAIRCYREALVNCPSNANAYYNLGVSYAEMHKYDKALINYQLTVHFDPRCAEAYNNMGVIFKEQENLEKALKYYHLAIQCNPRFAQSLNNLGVAYTTSGRLTEAFEYLARAVSVAPNYAEAYNNLGWLFWDHGDLAQALRMYERCIELSPASKNPSQNRLLALNYLHGVSSELVFQVLDLFATLGPSHGGWGGLPGMRMNDVHAQRDLLKPERTADSTPKGPSAAPSREKTQAEDFPKWVFLVIFFRSTAEKLITADDSTASRCYFGVTLMIFLGFGYLRAFLKAYGLGAIGFTMLIASLGMQWSMILESLARQAQLVVDSNALLHADLGVAAVLVSFGAMIGRISPTQIVMLVLMELPVYTINKVFVIHQFDAWRDHTSDPTTCRDTSKHVRDGGSTIVVHVFGAYFGLAAATVLGPAVKDRLKCSSYQSDIFSLIGTIFLWMFLPTFVAVGQVTPDLQSKAIVNTILALLTSTVTSFGLTQILQDGKIGTRAVQNATLAGGVTIGATASIVGPFGAGLLGILAGALSTVAFAHSSMFKSVDSCGIHNLHGLPGLLGGLFSIVSPLFYNDTGLATCTSVRANMDLRTAAASIGLNPSDLRIEPYSDAAWWTGDTEGPVIEL